MSGSTPSSRCGGAWEKVRDGETRLVAMRETAAAKADAATAAEAARIAADARAADAEAACADADAACERLAPIWEQAARLDARIRETTQDEALKTAARDAARAEAQAASDLVAELTRRIEAARTRRAEVEAALARDAGLAPLATRFAELSESLDKRTVLLAEIAELEAGRARAAQTTARAADARAGLDAADAADAGTRASCDARLAEKRSALDALDEPAARARAEALEEADRIAARLADAFAKATLAADAQAAAQARREAAALAWSEARDAAPRADEASGGPRGAHRMNARLVDLGGGDGLGARGARARRRCVPGGAVPGLPGWAEHPPHAQQGTPHGRVADARVFVQKAEPYRTRRPPRSWPSRTRVFVNLVDLTRRLAEARGRRPPPRRDGHYADAATLRVEGGNASSAPRQAAPGRGTWKDRRPRPLRSDARRALLAPPPRDLFGMHAPPTAGGTPHQLPPPRTPRSRRRNYPSRRRAPRLPRGTTRRRFHLGD